MLVPLRYLGYGVMAKIIEGVVFVQPLQLSDSSILELCVAVSLVELDHLLVVVGNLEAVFVMRCTTVRLQLGLVDHAEHLLFPLSNVLKSLPPIKL